MKYNLGCGADYRHGWVNVDKFGDVRPDLLMDLEAFPWPIADEAADEVLLSRVVEELSRSTPTLLGVIKELYRIAKPGARITIRTVDPRHDEAFVLPVGIGGLTAESFKAFDLALNEDAIAQGRPDTPYGKYLEVDFSTRESTRFLHADWLQRWQGGGLSERDLNTAIQTQNNVVQGSAITLCANKPFSPGRSLRDLDALIVTRAGGLGDVLMALSAFKAIKSFVDVPIFLETAPPYGDFAALCPYVDEVFVDRSRMLAHIKEAGLAAIKHVDWSPVRYGLSRLHQVDAYLHSLGLSASDDRKGLVIDLPPGDPQQDRIDGRLGALPTGQKRMVLHPGVSDPNRTWSSAFWLEVATHLIGLGHAVVVIGKRDDAEGKGVATLDHPHLIDFTDVLDLKGSLYLLRQCDLLISADAGPVQIAGASDIGIIGLYSTVHPTNRLPYRAGSMHHKAIGITPGCGHAPCYTQIGDAVAELGRQSDVVAKDVNALFARWCVNDDRYACVNDGTTFGKFTEALEGFAL